MKTRIVKEVRGDGTIVYTPQFRSFLFWGNYVNIFRSVICFTELDAATRFLEGQTKEYLANKVVKKEYL